MQNETIKSILEKAADKEDESYLLYKNVASHAKDAQTRTILEKFAEEELKHKQVLENYNIKSLGNQEIKDMDRYGVSEYFTGGSLDENSDFKDVLVYAAKREKLACEFYDKMKRVVADGDLKRLFDWLAREESKHKVDLEALFWDVVYR